MFVKATMKDEQYIYTNVEVNGVITGQRDKMSLKVPSCFGTDLEVVSLVCRDTTLGVQTHVLIWSLSIWISDMCFPVITSVGSSLRLMVQMDFHHPFLSCRAVS